LLIYLKFNNESWPNFG